MRAVKADVIIKLSMVLVTLLKNDALLGMSSSAAVSSCGWCSEIVLVLKNNELGKTVVFLNHAYFALVLYRQFSKIATAV